MDYRDLLYRYMAHVDAWEGSTFLEHANEPNPPSGLGASFSVEELVELRAIAERVRKLERE